jgi:hypothetical protein
MARCAFRSRLFRVLLETIEELPQRAVGHEDGGELDNRAFGSHWRAANSHDFKTAAAVLERFQFQLDARRAFELNIKARLCPMHSDVYGRTVRFGLSLRLRQRIAKSSRVTLPIWRAGVDGLLDLPWVRPVGFYRGSGWNKEVLSISRGRHLSATPKAIDG